MILRPKQDDDKTLSLCLLFTVKVLGILMY